ncbi:chromatin modification-related protein EAF1 B-like isoform X1 [Nicotiana tomentosiformis]|uniref:chromatin modification-related protein EAF1 B-like isoform X1 n=1 Tax=Nicotiana tomentosiformis TaxID=4098 RepID=UPI00051B3601|nr:chromatin modification-related protein EAF1 B-like isoform X1 [Nicotiana tomentosiformis]XP_009621988.1 chromatin modification-related protein EAF1 B-like isoform X1 [Nicotiana tomentosiformis]XP_009621990.1 chromatin modification-related protein EAF1 B-like isoform X1 [Nicotiana tomentosiformis]XP_009621991.1 chromatin modification-related protein EAF1 B-like isoform X1 [Nicotiana tomentosiformis]XP_009621992.1 chromatin modification-related protein EAF1 B-like isoform X1 [Nicotiana tomento
MHGCGAESDPVVNAEVDSMGGVLEGGVGIGNITSPRRSAIEEVQLELRQEYCFLEEKRRELEFLEKGGDPLDFKFGNAASLSVQSTSLTDQHPDQLVTSEAKGSFAITASPHGDSVESSGRLGAPQLCEPNSADNLMLFDGENEFTEGDRSSRHPGRSKLTPSEQSFKLDRSRNAKELGDSAAFGVPRKAYKRRYRSRPNDVKGLVSDGENPKDQNSSLNIAVPSSPKGCMPVKTLASEVDGVKAAESTTYLKTDDLADSIPEASASRDLLDNQHDQNSHTGVKEMSIQEGPERPPLSLVEEAVGSAGQEGQSCTAAAGLGKQASSSQINGFSCGKSDQKSIPNDAQSSGAALGTKGLDSESSCTRTTLDRNNDSEMIMNPKNLDSKGDLKEQLSVPEGTPIIESNLKKQKEVKAGDGCGLTNEVCNSGPKNHQNYFLDTSQEEFVSSEPNLLCEVKDNITTVVEAVGPSPSETERKPSTNTSDSSNLQKGNACIIGRQVSVESRIPEPSQHVSQHGVSNLSPEAQASGINVKLATRGDEDSILKEAQIIEAKRKRIAELSAVTFPVENRRKSHWDYVLEEMVWLANDFAQERLWKMTAAAQMCHRVAFTARSRFQEQNSSWELKKVAHIMAKAVMGFWQSIEGKSKKLELPIFRKGHTLAIREYAMRFLKYNDSDVPQSLAEAPVTPERVSDAGIIDAPQEDHFREENLFYAVSLGAMDAYRKSIESHVLHYEKFGMHEEVETSACITVPDFGSQDYAFEEDEGETSPYDISVAIEGNKLSRFSQKKRKILIKAYNGRSYDVRTDVPFTQRAENKLGTHQSMQLGKRPASNLNVSIPTKRMRTASRQRVLSPYSATTSGCAQLPIKTDASSGDTSSFQDDQSTLHGGSHMPNSLDVESVGDFEKHLPFDSSEVSKPKKKKKSKILGAYEQRWKADSNFQNEQRDFSRKRLESHQLDSNGSNGLVGQHMTKKPKMMRQSLENSFENIGAGGGFVPSPAASQMSNMSNPNKLMRMLSGRDQGRRGKTLKTSAGQPGSGSPWSLFEDQALVVLVHDMGPNWELVSDAFNSTLQFKCIYRKPKECKERHKILMDRSSGDGADSADDSGSSQPYPSTLPGIPKGSARQLFQRLQGPMEEDTLRSHFEKMIMIGQKYLLRKNQGYKHDPRHLQQPHDSHTHVLSKHCTNNLNGGPIFTPLDLCDAPSSPDYLSVGCQGPHPSELSISSQCALNSVLPASGANSAVQGSSNMISGNNFPSSPLNASVRDGRYVVPRSASLPVDEQQRFQQYNQMRNMQSNMAAPGVLAATDRGGARILSSGNSTGMMCGINRGIPMARPGFQGVASSSILNSGSMLSSGMGAMPNTVNMHSGVSSNQVNSMMRPHDGLHMIRPPQNQEVQRQMMLPELQGNSQVISPFGGLSSSFPNQSASPVTSYPLHHRQSQQPPMLSPHRPHLQGANHATNSQQQAYAIRLAKERHLQQRLVQQQQFSHSQPQLPISSSLQNSPKTTSQSSSPPVSLSPLTSPTSMTPMPQHHALPNHGLARTAQTGGSTVTTQMSKQRQRQIGQQQLQQAGRHHPPQRQQSQSQQQAKLLKGVGRGNMMMHQNLQIDPSLLNGLSNNQTNQSAKKGEQATHLMQGHGLYSGTAHSPVQLAKQAVAPHSSSQPQPKIYSGQLPPSTKHLQQQMPNQDNSNQGPGSLAPSDTISSQQSVPSSVTGSSDHQGLVHQQPQVQPQPKLMNQSQATVQRVLQQNHVVNSDQSKKLQAGEPQAEQHPMCKTSQIGAITSMLQDVNDATNVADVSTLSANQWKGTEPLCDSIGTPPTNSAGSESVPQISQGVSQRQSSGNLAPTGPDSFNWQQKSSQLQPPSSVTQPQLQQQLSPLQHSQEQAQILQAGNSSSFARSNDCRLD